MFHVMTIFGTRPEAIKLAPLIVKLNSELTLNHSTLVTGQHDELLDEVLSVFDITPDYNLKIMRKVNSLGSLYSVILKEISEILTAKKPDLVIVHGDTATTFAASMAAYLNQIPVAHIEAGLRTGNLYSPWPEEGNRQLVSKITKLHFAPTNLARQNLISENILKETILVTGNTVIDALFQTVDHINNTENIRKSCDLKFEFLSKSKKLILMTGHRRENFGSGFENTFKTIRQVVKSRNDIELVYPVHLNPNVKSQVNDILVGTDFVHLIEPLDYLSFVYLMQKSHLIITDSGGIQEEAPSLGKPILVTRNTTERPEAIEAGVAALVGNDGLKLKQSLMKLLDDQKAYDQVALAKNPFGDGNASDRILTGCLDYLKYGALRDA